MDAPTGVSPELIFDPYGEEVLSTSKEDFEALLEEFSGGFQQFREGEIVNANVLRVTDASVILEFGFKSEGSVALDEFKDPPNEGDEVEVLLESLEDDDGVVVLSKKKADFLRVWEKIREAHDADRPVKGTLVRKIKGGVTVDLMGVDAFLPGSQIALRRVPNIEDLIGEVYRFKIIKLNKRRRNIVVSRRVILEAERETKRESLVKELLVGQVREGIVKNITDFGAFIDLGGLDGLLHITDMSWGRVGHPSEVVDIAAKIDVKVLDIDWDRERISLGLKQLLPYPWTDIDKKYPVGSRVRGRVVSITNYGAFVELEKGVEGLVHISEMSWTRNVRHPSKVVSIGEDIEAVVLKVDPNDEKISLGMKQIEEDPWLALPVKYPTGTTLTGTVRNLTSFGAFVEIEPGIDGLVHVSDMSWTRRVEHPAEVVHKSEELEVMVLDVDAENKRISLGIKQLQDDPWPHISERFGAGVEMEADIVRVQDKGIVVDLGDDIEGFVPVSHTGIEDVERLEEYYGHGDTIDLRVIESDAANRRIVLEVTEVPERKSPEEIEAARLRAEEAAAAAAAAASAAEADDDEDFTPKAKKPAAETAEAAAEGAAEEADEVEAEAAEAPEPAAAAEESDEAADDGGEDAEEADEGADDGGEEAEEDASDVEASEDEASEDEASEDEASEAEDADDADEEPAAEAESDDESEDEDDAEKADSEEE
ncbi:MAG: 30S ribosomal protein S1 [Gemmatimonadetes bacterium]|nr:30S ribosomal protein S1 [Gemmatimonadota bacterium]NNL31511.1 30S ribosomal protein S1 [Gemmatimonadota bacterium]